MGWQTLNRAKWVMWSVFLGTAPLQGGLAGPMEDYVGRPDHHFNWKHTQRTEEPWGTVDRLEMVSQHWRGQFWSHHVVIVRPRTVRNPTIAFFEIAGDGNGDGTIDLLKTLAERGGAVAAAITGIPNQPLYDGRREDHLIAYTFDQYLKTGDETWPLLFPMVKGAVRGMDAVQAFVERRFGQPLQGFVVSGASKRGWTAWLTGAVDPRVEGLAPRVIDMLNMKAQLHWAERVYGKPSEEISEYTDLKLHLKLDDGPMQKLRSWIDPYAYAQRYTMPKLLLLGTNDPYWTVDSVRHYWDDLPGPKHLFQTPNAGHDLAGGREANQTLAAFFEMIAGGHPLPKMAWRLSDRWRGGAVAQVRIDQTAGAVRLWTSSSADRDFRKDVWISRELQVKRGSSRGEAAIGAAKSGYRAYLLEVELTSPSGHPYKLSTEARVTPDTAP